MAICANKLTLNVVKTEITMVGSRQRLANHTENFDLTIDGIALQQVHEVTCLGLLKVDENLTWKGHVQNIKNKIITNLRVTKKAKPYLNRQLNSH
jgi:hypothetical protein